LFYVDEVFIEDALSTGHRRPFEDASGLEAVDKVNICFEV